MQLDVHYFVHRYAPSAELLAHHGGTTNCWLTSSPTFRVFDAKFIGKTTPWRTAPAVPVALTRLLCTFEPLVLKRLSRLKQPSLLLLFLRCRCRCRYHFKLLALTIVC